MVTSGSASNVTITLPLAANNINRRIEIQKSDLGTKHVIVTSTDLLRGLNNDMRIISEGESAVFVSNGSEWKLLGNPYRTCYADISVNGTISVNAGEWLTGIIPTVTGEATLNIHTDIFVETPIGAQANGKQSFPISGSGLVSANVGDITQINATVRQRLGNGAASAGYNGVNTLVSITGRR